MRTFLQRVVLETTTKKKAFVRVNNTVVFGRHGWWCVAMTTTTTTTTRSRRRSVEHKKSDDDDDDDDESCVESFTESSSSTTLVLLRVLVARVLPRAFIPVRSDNMRKLATYVRSWTAYLSAAEPLERINKFRRKRSYMRRWSRIATLEIVLLSAVCIIKRDSVNNKEQLRQTPGVCT